MSQRGGTSSSSKHSVCSPSVDHLTAALFVSLSLCQRFMGVQKQQSGIYTVLDQFFFLGGQRKDV